MGVLMGNTSVMEEQEAEEQKWFPISAEDLIYIRGCLAGGVFMTSVLFAANMFSSQNNVIFEIPEDLQGRKTIKAEFEEAGEPGFAKAYRNFVADYQAEQAEKLQQEAEEIRTYSPPQAGVNILDPVTLQPVSAIPSP